MRNCWMRAAVGTLFAFVVAAGLFSAKTNARLAAEFSNRSLIGSYSLVGVGGANEAASVGITRFDGAGGATRTLTLNEPDPDGAGRLVIEIPATGSYTVRPDGTGMAIFLNELPDGSKIPFHFDFVVTEASRRGPRAKVATKIRLIQREPGIAAKLVIFDLARLPD